AVYVSATDSDTVRVTGPNPVPYRVYTPRTYSNRIFPSLNKFADPFRLSVNDVRGSGADEVARAAHVADAPPARVGELVERREDPVAICPRRVDTVPPGRHHRVRQDRVRDVDRRVAQLEFRRARRRILRNGRRVIGVPRAGELTLVARVFGAIEQAQEESGRSVALEWAAVGE